VSAWDLLSAADTCIKRVPEAATIVDFIESTASDDLIELQLLHNAVGSLNVPTMFTE
jgi:hypothetical protein